jgi:hypothetical protein
MLEQIAKITSTSLGWEDHGIFTVWLNLDYGGSGQGAGGYALDQPLRDKNDKFIKRTGTASGMDFIIGIIRACGVEKWEDVEGRTVIALREGDGWGGKVIGLKPLPTERGTEFLFDSVWG